MKKKSKNLAKRFIPITTMAVNIRCDAAWIGTSQSLDFSRDGLTWVTFAGATAGTVIPVEAVAVRKTAGPAAPSVGDVVFLYE